MWTSNGADDIKMRFGIGYPIAQGLIHCVFQCTGTRRYRMDFGTKEAHPVDIWLLPLNIARHP